MRVATPVTSHSNVFCQPDQQRDRAGHRPGPRRSVTRFAGLQFQDKSGQGARVPIELNGQGKRPIRGTTTCTKGGRRLGFEPDGRAVSPPYFPTLTLDISGVSQKSGWRPPAGWSPVPADLSRPHFFDSDILSFTVAKFRDCPRPLKQNRPRNRGWRRRPRPQTTAQGLTGRLLNFPPFGA
jgi:hypothetical protein